MTFSLEGTIEMQHFDRAAFKVQGIYVALNVAARMRHVGVTPADHVKGYARGTENP
jgi:hypothetical protein